MGKISEKTIDAAIAKPDSVLIMGKKYTITYCEKPSDVDIFKRESYWGQVDYWTRSIRIYETDRSLEDIWATIMHEVLHAIGEALKLDILDMGKGKDEHRHNELDVLALALVDFLVRNKLLCLQTSVTENE